MKQPLIVCGLPRSGTRYCASLLHAHPLVAIQGEQARGSLNRMLGHISAAEEEFADKPARMKMWKNKRYDAVERFFEIGSKSKIITKPEAAWFGHKTPGHERHFARYEALFDDPARPARYIYCQRPALEVWRSLRSMPWYGKNRDDVGAFIETARKSLDFLRRMQKRADGRVHVFELSRAKTDPTGLATDMCNFLGLDSAPVERAAERMGPRNSSAQKLGTKPEDLPADHAKAIKAAGLE